MTHNTDAELLPCPFCGELPIVAKHFREDMHTLIHRCKVAGAISWDFGCKARHIEQWNTRAPAAPVPQGWKLVPIEPHTGRNYEAGLWSRRNWEAALEDQAAAPQPPESGCSVSNGVTLAVTKPCVELAPLTAKQIDAAAKCIAESMDYPWGGMMESGRESMRAIAKAAIERAHNIK